MKQVKILKTKSRLSTIIPTIFLVVVISYGTGLQQVRAQDPFARLKQAAQAEPADNTVLSKVKVSPGNPTWKGVSRTPIPFKPFPMVDKNGNPIPPTEKITLKNGKTFTAQEFFSELNDAERKLNAQGYSLRKNQQVVASKTVTSAQDLDAKVRSMPAPVRAFRTETELEAFMSPTKKVGAVTLKPIDEYSASEKAAVQKYKFKSSAGKIAVAGNATYVPASSSTIASTAPLKTINETTSKEWSFGSSRTFKAGIRGTLNRYAKIYHFDTQHPDKSMSEFKISADGKVYGSLFNHSMDLLSSSAEVFAPADVSKKMTAKLVMKVGSTTVLNLNESYAQSKSFSGRKARVIERSFAIEVPIVFGIDFNGKVGIRGEGGMEYGANLYRTFVSLKARPLAQISGYAEAGVDFLGIFGGGVGGRLSFVKGDLELQAFIGLWNQDAEQIVVAYSYYFGYDLELLKGNLYCYVEACIPWTSWCTRYEHNFFSWSGYKRSGTIAEKAQSYVLANL